MSVSRFWAKVEPEYGCWLWTGSVLKSGYGSVVWNGRSARAHRVAYELTFGPIPNGLDIHHICGERLCVNPAHLEPMKHGEHAALHVRRPSHCPHGHPYDEANTYVTGSGMRQCRTCNRERKATAYALARSLKPIKEKVSSDW